MLGSKAKVGRRRPFHPPASSPESRESNREKSRKPNLDPIRLRGNACFSTPRPSPPLNSRDRSDSPPLIFVSVRKNSALCFLKLTRNLIAPLFRLEVRGERIRIETVLSPARYPRPISNRDTLRLETPATPTKQTTEVNPNRDKNAIFRSAISAQTQLDVGGVQHAPSMELGFESRSCPPNKTQANGQRPQRIDARS